MTDALSLNTRTCQCCNFRVTPAMVKAALIITAIASALIAYLGTTPALAAIATPIGGGICLVSLITLVILCCRKKQQDPQSLPYPEVAYSNDQLQEFYNKGFIPFRDEGWTFINYQLYYGNEERFQTRDGRITTLPQACHWSHRDHLLYLRGTHVDIQEQAEGTWCSGWRCLQTLLASTQQFPTFKSLYRNFSESHDLSQKKPLTANAARALLEHYHIPATTNYYFPPHITFENFCLRISEHFSKRNALPVLAFGSGSSTKTIPFLILGIKEDRDHYIFLRIADPNEKDKGSALYYIILDRNGTKLGHTGFAENAASIYPARGLEMLLPHLPNA